ncbi:MAG: hypothetical protein US74_C0034G0009 [Parcubacteria group bacterium GW2011_GWA2_38_13]|uniref:N-acetyltransferase domain-containing protein n=1 Tax=Candidatus Roizmanbacteria bacterium GW2011_GWC2_35_12 TaxID=1618485 RepID=A0A0G0DRI7_9BACT|nr:MAG: hypothetical protein UR63_C0047G0003 [Candidatus Roizmanbacteria bacterium GW2011_GWC2_35_12]KKQ55344.1 MAG: hypothetical protein US74_C0034G0009 [Parcubacteria group bacterium GW2011_GWA2_38_13]
MKKIIFKTGDKDNFNQFLEFFRNNLGNLFPHYSANSIGYTIDLDYSPAFLKREFESGVKELFLAYYEEKIAGYLLFAKSIAGVSFADWLAVDKPYRKQGIAAKLLSLWEEKAIKEGAYTLFLWTTLNNIQFYKNRGFALGGILPKAWHGVDCYIIYKNLMEPKEENYLRDYIMKKNKS